jgi:hypothetical protein
MVNSSLQGKLLLIILRRPNPYEMPGWNAMDHGTILMAVPNSLKTGEPNSDGREENPIYNGTKRHSPRPLSTSGQ